LKSFITGSHIYGKPTSDSDIDLVIFVNQETKDKLIELSDTGKMPCRFGKLNLIFATNEEEYGAWLLGKILCKEEFELNKKDAFQLHEKARLLFSTQYDHDSGKDGEKK